MKTSNKNVDYVQEDGFLNEKIEKKNVIRKKYSKREYLEFKLKICQKYCQVHPFIVITQPDAVRCLVCCEATYDSAIVSFMDRKKDKSEKQFTIERVCPECLDRAGLIFVNRNQISRYVVLQRGHVLAKLDSVGGDFKNCFICKNAKIAIGTVRIKIKGMYTDVPLCESHFNKCLIDKTVQKKIEEDEETVKEIKQFSDEMEVTLDIKSEVEKFNEGYSMAPVKSFTDEVDEEFSKFEKVE